MATKRQVRLDGETYILIDGGAITTPDDYLAGRCSYAHLTPDGRIMRFRQQIGTEDDLEQLGEIEIGEPGIGTLLGILSDDSWPFNREVI